MPRRAERDDLIQLMSCPSSSLKILRTRELSGIESMNESLPSVFFVNWPIAVALKRARMTHRGIALRHDILGAFFFQIHDPANLLEIVHDKYR